MPLPPPVVPVSEVALMDAAAVTLGHDLLDAMERAGAAVAHMAQQMAPKGAILVACGPGNNGGDGYVAARLLAQAGRRVSVWPIVPPRSDLCRINRERLPDSVHLAAAPPAKAPALVIDAVLGAGATGTPRSPIREGLAALRGISCPVLAIDIPSGLGSDDVLPATRTLCLQAAKRELMGAAATREFTTVDIGLPTAAWQEVQPACLARFPGLAAHAHKGMNGELLVVGGGTFPGALEFACRAANLTGCDLVRAWTSEGPPLPPTVVVHRQPGSHLVPSDPSDLTPYLVRAGAVLIGNGLGRDPRAHEAAQQALSLALEMDLPVILDADGISACAEQIRALRDSHHRVLLTPHRGEMRTLLGQAAAPEEEQVHAFAHSGRVVLAKGPVDLVTDGWRWQRNHRGNPRLAVGGTGDVLAGLAGGLMARGCTPYDAARIAVLWLTEAGDELWAEDGPCFDALDLLRRLPATLRRLFALANRPWPPLAQP